jgi:hypothetical protein
MDADTAWIEVRPYIVQAARDVLLMLEHVEHALNDDGPEAQLDDEDLGARLRSRVALGEGYGWNLYELSTAWRPDRVRSELLDELLDAIVYRALWLRLEQLSFAEILGNRPT